MNTHLGHFMFDPTAQRGYATPQCEKTTFAFTQVKYPLPTRRVFYLLPTPMVFLPKQTQQQQSGLDNINYTSS